MDIQNRKPRLLAFTNLYPRSWEPGRASFNRQQFEHLSQWCDISVLSPVAWTDCLSARKNPAFSMQPVQIGSVCAHYTPYFFIPRLARFSYGVSMFFSVCFAFRRRIKSDRPDAILAAWIYPDATAAIIIGRLFKIPVIIKAHGSDINESPFLPGVKKQIMWTLKKAPAIISVSRDLADKMIALGAPASVIRVIYNGVDLKAFQQKEQMKCRKKLGLDQEGKIVLFVGNLKQGKGCLDLLESFAGLLDVRPGVRLIYVGSGNCEAIIKQKAKALGIDKNILLPGQQPHQSLPDWMNAADIVTLPSHNEGVPNVLLEAMACGRPVVATAVGGIPEVVPEYAGYLTSVGHLKELAEKLDQALSVSWDHEKIIQHAKNFTWTANSHAIKQLFYSLKGRNHA